MIAIDEKEYLLDTIPFIDAKLSSEFDTLQLSIEENLIENADLMKDGQAVEVLVHAEEEKIIGCELPAFVILQVTYTEPGIRGDTATNASKPATLETGAEIQVPLFVNQEDVLKIDTRNRSYVERVKQ